jgi:hypothetical protein
MKKKKKEKEKEKRNKRKENEEKKRKKKKRKKKGLPSDSILNLTKGPTVCYLSCRGVNCRKTLFWPLQVRQPY